MCDQNTKNSSGCDLMESLRITPPGLVSLVGGGGKTSLMYCLAGEAARSGQAVLTTTTTKIFPPGPEQSPFFLITNDLDEVIDFGRNMPGPGKHFTAAGKRLDAPGKLKGYSSEAIDELYARKAFDLIIVEADGSAGKPLKAHAGHEPVIPRQATEVVCLIGLTVVGTPLGPDRVHRPEIYSRLTDLPLQWPVTVESIAKAVVHPKGLFKDSPPSARRILFLNQADNSDLRRVGYRLAETVRDSEGRQPNLIVIGALKEDQSPFDTFQLSGQNNGGE